LWIIATLAYDTNLTEKNALVPIQTKARKHKTKIIMTITTTTISCKETKKWQWISKRKEEVADMVPRSTMGNVGSSSNNSNEQKSHCKIGHRHHQAQNN
jgi:hypothetical protein